MLSVVQRIIIALGGILTIVPVELKDIPELLTWFLRLLLVFAIT